MGEPVAYASIISSWPITTPTWARAGGLHGLREEAGVLEAKARPGGFARHAVLEQLLRRPRDGVGGVVDARGPVAVAVGRDAVPPLAGGMAGCAAPLVARGTADAD